MTGSLTLYIHLPWCVQKCPYCDFNSHGLDGLSRDGLDLVSAEQQYIEALLADLEQALPLVWGRAISAVFIGGGTPNVFSPQAIDQLLAGCRARLAWLPGIEVTMEANPGAGRDQADWLGYRQAGINRLSVGVQSFHAQSLAALGRVHTADQAQNAVTQATQVFDRVNLDLMYGLPGQTLQMACDDLAMGLSLGVGHLSLYQLTIEPNTVFANKPPVLPEDDLIYDMQLALMNQLDQAGLERYEVSAYAKPGQRCAHNLNYWQFGDYLGIGAGAHSKLSAHADASGSAQSTNTAADPIANPIPSPIGAGLVVSRHNCLRRPQDYMAAVARRDGSHRRRVAVEPSELPFEFMLNGLRLVEGFSPALYRERTGLPLETVLPGVQQAVAKGLLSADVSCWRPSAKGLDFLNDLQELFLHN
ncbi:MAG: radical SAM family heme chaperone HemW [Burkholderiaceae bacterium]